MQAIKNITTYDNLGAIIEFLLSCPVVYFDTETTGLDPHTGDILLLSLHGNNGVDTFTFTFDLVRMGMEVLHELKAVFHNPAILKVAHNAIFDWKWLYHACDVYVSPVMCTMINEQVIKSGLLFSGFGLDDVAERRLGVKMDKSIRQNFINRDINISFTDEELTYAAEDTVVLEGIYYQQMKEIAAEGLGVVIDTESALIPITAQLEYNGICIDVDKLRAAKPVAESIVVNATQRLQDEIIQAGAATEITFDKDGYSAVNVGSPKQMLDAFNQLGINVKSLGKKELSDWDATWARKQKVKSSADGDDELDVGFAHPVLRQHGIRTAAAKLEGTYISGLLGKVNTATGRIHPGFKQCGAVSTGRMSSVSPNFQNLPTTRKLAPIGMQDHDIRSMFIPAPGCDFIICDYSGIELSILAAMSGDEQLIHQIIAGDIHSFVANELAGNSIRGVLGELITPKNKKSNDVAKSIRDLFKPVSYGIIYGSTGYNLYRTLYFDLLTLGIHITQDDADRWVEQWKHKLFPQTGALLSKYSEQAVTRYYTQNAAGRRRHWAHDVRFDKWRMLAAMREGSNHPIQSDCADMIKRAMVRLDSELDKERGRIVAPIHDEILSETRHDYTDDAMPIVQRCMEEEAFGLYPNSDRRLWAAEPKKSSKYDK